MQIRNHSYRYIDKHKDVYAIVLRNAPRHFGNTYFYSVPLNRVDSNCIITFLDEYQARFMCKELETDNRVLCDPKKYPLASLVEFTVSINMPTIVVVNSYCQVDQPECDIVHELYFAHDHQKNISNM